MLQKKAALTSEFMGNKVKRNYDVGIAGIHRLLSAWEELRKGSVYIVVAGMEGACQCRGRPGQGSGDCRSDQCRIWGQFWGYRGPAGDA